MYFAKTFIRATHLKNHMIKTGVWTGKILGFDFEIVTEETCLDDFYEVEIQTELHTTLYAKLSEAKIDFLIFGLYITSLGNESHLIALDEK